MKEKFIEDTLRIGVRNRGGLCEKFTSPGTRDVPDRLVTWPWGEMDLVETKAPGQKPRAGQTRDHRERAKLGIPVYLLSTPDEVWAYLRGRGVNRKHMPELFSVPVTEPLFMAEYKHVNCDCSICRPFTT
jgi:hypothetical protein